MLDNITKKPTKTKVSFMDVYKEFNDVIAPSLGLDKFRSKKVTKNFAFSVPNVKVPSTCDYLEVSGRNFLSINYDGGLFLNKKLEKFVFQINKILL